MTDDPRPKPSALLPVLVLVALVLLLAGGALIFPSIAAYMSQQDCIASGRSNCMPLK